ncbi:unnamed protein product [Rotaria socialis]|uniref:MULE transposase domain-containing protein n=2 Tax=Rotaria socialis TaxID=392032 RepID=A0A821GEQ5_9BILA|nr:unnamed protein product [Rotaria socialis]
MKIKPKRILEILEKKSLHVPKKQQLSSYLISLRKKYYGASTISLDELDAWCQRNSLIPDDDDKSWVLKYQIEYEDEINKDDDNKNKFRFFVTARRLLFNARSPCFIIGTTDMITQFHPFGFTVCSNEKQNEFEFIFSCLRDDLLNLNLQMNEQELILITDDAEVISNAFLKIILKKWKNEDKFLRRFSYEWLNSKNEWLADLATHVPSTNNALEATNRVIKDEDTLRERLVLSRFTVVLYSIVNKWSKERNPTLINSKKFKHQPLITHYQYGLMHTTGLSLTKMLYRFFMGTQHCIIYLLVKKLESQIKKSNDMKIAGLIHLARTSLFTSIYGAYVSLTILKNGKKQHVPVHHL